MRGLLLVLLAVGLGAGAWLFLNPAVEDGYGPTDEGGAAEIELEIESEAGLVGRALDERVQMAVTERPKGIYVISGAVLDADGKPAAGVKIEAVFNQPGWADHSPEAVAWRAHDRVVARAARELREGPDRTRNVLADAVSDAKGEFKLDVGRTGTYHVQARPDAPLIGARAWAQVNRNIATPEVTLRIAEGHALTGRVETEGGAPVKAIVTASLGPATPGATRLIADWRSEPTPSAEDGSFALPAAPLGKLLFDVSVPGRLTLRGLRAKHEEGEPIKLTVPGGTATIEGQVVGSEDEAIQGADVIVSIAPIGKDAPRQIEVSTRSASDGTWRLDALPAGEVQKIRAVAPGYVALMQTAPQAAWAPLPLEADTKRTLTLRLLRGGTVRGRVTVADAGTPIAGTKVRLAMMTSPPGHDRQPLREALTDAEGHYAIPGVPAGRYVLFATHESHYMPALVRAITAHPGAAPLPAMRGGFIDDPELTVVMPREGGDQERNFSMRAGLRLEGVVLDPEGATVEGANVVVLIGLHRAQVPGSNTNGAEPITSGPDGRFEIANLPPGKGFVLVAKKAGYAAEKSEPVDLAEGTPAGELTLKLAAGAVVKGVVVDEEGNPVIGAQVSLWGGNQGLAGGNTHARTNAEGAFEIKGLPPGDFQHWAWAPGGMNAQGQGPKGVGAGEVRDGLRIEMRGRVQTNANPAKGRIVDDKGRPIASRMVQMRSTSMHNTMQTDADGMFVIPNHAHDEPITLSVFDANGQTELAKDVTFAEGEVREFVYTPPARQRIVGHVYDPQGTRVPLFSFALKGKGGAPSPMVYGMEGEVIMDASLSMPGAPGMRGGGEAINGEFMLDVVGEGPWTIVISRARDRHGRSVGLAKLEHVVEKLPSGPVEIRLAPGETIQGRVVDTHGKPVPGVLISCAETKDTSDEEGNFALAGMSGETTLYATPPSGQGWVRPKPTKVKPGDTVELEIEEGLSISGSVTTEAGEALANLNVNAQWQGGEGFSNGNTSVRPDAKGQFELKGIPARAKVTINVWAWGNAQGYTPFSKQGVAPGTRDMRIVMTRGAPISGSVVDSDGKPLKTGYVMAQPVDKGLQMGWGQIGSDGTFTIANTKPGKYRLTVQGGATPGQVKVGEVEAPSSGLELRLPAQATITGRIASSEKGFRILAYRVKDNNTEVHNGSVKANGDFSVTLPEGGAAWTLFAHAASAGHYGFARDVAAGTDGASIQTQPGRAIKGRVEGADGKGLPNAQVRATTTTKDPVNATARADKDGNFELKGLPDGKYNLTAWAPGGSKSKKDVEAGTVDVVLK